MSNIIIEINKEIYLNYYPKYNSLYINLLDKSKCKEQDVLRKIINDDILLYKDFKRKNILGISIDKFKNKKYEEKIKEIDSILENEVNLTFALKKKILNETINLLIKLELRQLEKSFGRELKFNSGQEVLKKYNQRIKYSQRLINSLNSKKISLGGI